MNEKKIILSILVISIWLTVQIAVICLVQQAGGDSIVVYTVSILVWLGLVSSLWYVILCHSRKS
jgi:hypothetical protein